MKRIYAEFKIDNPNSEPVRDVSINLGSFSVADKFKRKCGFVNLLIIVTS